MSLVKIPFILAASYGYHRCMSPPNKAPPKQEQYFPKTGFARLWEVGMRSVLSIGNILDAAQCLLAAIECIAICSAMYPNSTLAQISAPYLASSHPTTSTFTKPNASFIIAFLFAISGYAFRVYSFHVLGKMFTFELTTQRDHRLVTVGPYSIVRHPSYTGGMVGFFGHAATVLGSQTWIRESGFLGTPFGAVLAGFWVFGMCALFSFTVVRAASEDEMMRAAFKEDWEEWAARVPYRLFPGVY
ncbi:hypothetical protein CYLTODRAFT_417837 [Cylindrobasidium torrendii FP15055 ss-10]|uniref:Protein-S-isoprenylcysteine O-methyltransferase n=1 Tax=Cylindrobasidium torrendii FP15055 ss-10 TaxID=1314674 RepID=A0A0D7BS48_9AGAR|nr:hypothetical protein CYLTODRAFT_417837 [Cylindrobasidium torrendii FP15055 ss-10]